MMCSGLVKLAASCGCKGAIALIASGEPNEHVWRRLRDVTKRKRGKGRRRKRGHKKALADNRAKNGKKSAGKQRGTIHTNKITKDCCCGKQRGEKCNQAYSSMAWGYSS